MSPALPPDDRRDLRVRLVAAPVSVPGARRMVRDGLREWGLDHLVDDVSLCVTELVSNAALHSGSRFMDVELRDLGGAVELAVVDEGDWSEPSSVSPRTSPAMRSETAVLVAAEPTTGRGLAIVSMLARDWGVTDANGRRRVWAVLAADPGLHPVRPPRRDEGVAAAAGADILPEHWKLVVVPDAPIDLSVRIDQNIDEVIRELQLIDTSPESPTAEQARLIQELISVPFARHTARAQVLEAAEGGLTHVDVRLPMPREAAGSVRALLVAMREADLLCRHHQLLALPATPEMDLLREWFTHNMVTQLEDDADPTPYDEWLAARDG